jgi:MtN3 and saliva related transmembrane protein
LTIEHVGFAAAACTTCSFIPQAWVVWKARAAPGISTGMYAMFITGVALWCGYGLAIHAWPLVLANAVTLVLAVAIISMKLIFERYPEKYAAKSPRHPP